MFRSIAIACLLNLFLVATGLCQADTKEPPQQFELTVDGKAQVIELDKEFEIDLQGSTKFKLKASPTRNFKFAGLRFPYPSFFAFEAEHDVDSKLWTLDGNDCVLMVFAFPGDASIGHRDIAKQIGSQYGRKTTYSKTKLSGTGFVLKGTEIYARVAGAELKQQVFQVPTDDGTRLLLIQDSLEDDGTHTTEFQSTRDGLKTNLKIDPSIAQKH